MRLNINGEMYYPKDFLPVVEKENYSHFITKAVLNKVCKHIKQLEHEKYNFDKISVNLSTEDLLINDGYKTLINIVEKVNGISFEKIAFEILEGTDKVSYEPLVKTMVALKTVTDVEFYLDDFGTGYSNLSRLLSLPISIVKFDKIPPTITIKTSVTSRALPIFMLENFLIIRAITSVPPELELT
jgi:EAL domain-containing protein (putative c-di-GMP-specific phosphodiesterase class I)